MKGNILKVTVLFVLQYSLLHVTQSAPTEHQKDERIKSNNDVPDRKKRDTCMQDALAESVCDRCSEFVPSVSHDQCCRSGDIFERCISVLVEVDSVENLLPGQLLDDNDDENSSNDDAMLLSNKFKTNLDNNVDSIDDWKAEGRDLDKRGMSDDLDLLLRRPDEKRMAYHGRQPIFSNEESMMGYEQKRGGPWEWKPHSGESHHHYPDYTWFKRSFVPRGDYTDNFGDYGPLMSKRGGHGLSGSYNRVWWRGVHKRPDENKVFRNFNRIWWKNGRK